MRDHIALGKLASLVADAAAEARRDLIEERGVEIDLLVDRTIEWSHLALRFSAATDLCPATIENQHWRAIVSSILGEDLFPLQFGSFQYFGELLVLLA